VLQRGAGTPASGEADGGSGALPTGADAPAPRRRGVPVRAREPHERSRARQGWVWAALAVVLACALALRLWGIKEGLPYVYDIDEAAHFVPRAIEMSGSRLNPHYFGNPPALTYLLHFIFAALYGGFAGATREAARHPGDVYLVARVTVAVLGVVAVSLLYVLGTRLFGRTVGLLAAALEAVAFLPVFYSHLALNDVPALVPLTLSLIGSAGIMQRGRARDYALAGVGLGLGAATKYTAGIAVLPLLAATVIQHLQVRKAGAPSPPSRPSGAWPTPAPARPSRSLPAAAGLALAACVALLAFLAANPYALLDFHRFVNELAHESAVAEEAGGKLGSPRELGALYYLWVFTWGLGFVPALAALGGAVAVWFKDRRVEWLLTPMVVAYLVFMGTEDRYFGRWLMPLLPVACVLAAFFALGAAGALARALGRPGKGSGAAAERRGALISVAVGVLAAAVLLAQGVLYSVHVDAVLARPDTRASARAWMLAHVPEGARVVVEPVVPQAWMHEDPALGPLAARYRPSSARAHWSEYPSLLTLIAPAAGNGSRRWRDARHFLRLEDYEYTLTPALIDYYEQQGYCWVVTGSIQSGRASADPSEAPAAIAYYRALAARARLAYRLTPYSHASSPVDFSFDWSYDYYPLAYRLPGPEMTVYRLLGGRCATSG
jgi:4-amino-4-deoxy-L-arabinose transferase-like glycosyltransferase